MDTLALHDFHQTLGATFTSVNAAETVQHFGDPLAEHHALQKTAGVLDLSFRSRLCAVGADRVRFLHGQVTNDIRGLEPGQGCYAALVTAKGRMESDLNIYCLEDELLLDFEPGLAATVAQRLERYVVADDVQVIDVAAVYGMLSIQGPAAGDVMKKLAWLEALPTEPFQIRKCSDPALGDLYVADHSQLGSPGFDLFAPVAALKPVANDLVKAAGAVGGRPCGWQAFETARVEAGRPRFGVDMDDHNFPQEAGIEAGAVSYTKGCYIGQEVLNRIHTLGHVNRGLCGLRLADDLVSLPKKGDKLVRSEKEVGWITSAVRSPSLKANIALGYVHKDARRPGTELIVRSASGDSVARPVNLPFQSG